jgi:uncharacterized protein
MTANRYKKVKSMALWAPLFSAHQWKEEWQKAKVQMEQQIPADQVLRINGQIAGEEFVQQIFQMDLNRELKELESIPLLHMHGEKDTIVSVEHAELYQKHRGQAKGRSHFIRLPHADHDFTIVEVQRQVIDETCHWFKQTL